MVPLTELLRIITLINAPCNLRYAPQATDRRDRHFDAWFDGGAIVMPTGGATEYFFDDGIEARWVGLAPQLRISMHWPDGRTVNIVEGNAKN